MADKEAQARIKINKLLEESGWRFLDDDKGKANIVLEHNVKITTTQLDSLGNNFEKTGRGFVDFLLLNEQGYPLVYLRLKRKTNLRSLARSRPGNMPSLKTVWMGVTVERGDYKHRIEFLRNTNAAIKFLSLEPLLSDVPNLNLAGIDWVIVGGESGPRARPMRQEWVESIQSQCERNSVPFFFKQWGGVNKKKAGRLLHGKTFNEIPATAYC